jgi:hypothetical protein
MWKACDAATIIYSTWPNTLVQNNYTRKSIAVESLEASSSFGRMSRLITRLKDLVDCSWTKGLIPVAIQQ